MCYVKTGRATLAPVLPQTRIASKAASVLESPLSILDALCSDASPLSLSRNIADCDDLSKIKDPNDAHVVPSYDLYDSHFTNEDRVCASILQEILSATVSLAVVPETPSTLSASTLSQVVKIEDWKSWTATSDSNDRQSIHYSSASSGPGRNDQQQSSSSRGQNNDDQRQQHFTPNMNNFPGEDWRMYPNGGISPANGQFTGGAPRVDYNRMPHLLAPPQLEASYYPLFAAELALYQRLQGEHGPVSELRRSIIDAAIPTPPVQSVALAPPTPPDPFMIRAAAAMPPLTAPISLPMAPRQPPPLPPPPGYVHEPGSSEWQGVRQKVLHLPLKRKSSSVETSGTAEVASSPAESSMSPSSTKRPADPADPDDPETAESVTAKRARNAEAARRSRARKLARIEFLEKQVAALEREKEELKERIVVLEKEKREEVSQVDELKSRVLFLEGQLSDTHSATVFGDIPHLSW